MAKETVWRIGPTMRNIYNSLNQRLGVVLQSQDLYLDDDFLLSINIHKEDLNLDDTDDYFHCMTEEAFVNLQPTDLTDPFTTYEDIEHPCSDPPTNVFELEHCARGIDGWFWDLQRAKVSEDGNGMWPAGPDFWIPRPLQKYENIGNLSKYWPAVPWDLSRAMSNTSNKPHQIYSSWHGHEGKDGVILRNELEILFKTMKGKMTDAAFCTHIVPVLLLSIHGAKARIMIAHINRTTMTLNIKCGKLEQLDGFEAKGREGDAVDRARPCDVDGKRDHFFRWLNPTCQGETFLEDSKFAPEKVLRGPKGRKRLVLRKPLPRSTDTEDV